MRDETLTLIGVAFIVISGVCWAILAGSSLMLFLPLEVVAGVFLVAVAAAAVDSEAIITSTIMANNFFPCKSPLAER